MVDYLMKMWVQYKEKVICFKKHYNTRDLCYSKVSFRKQGIWNLDFLKFISVSWNYRTEFAQVK